MAQKVNTGRSRGHTRRRGSYQVLVYAGLDPRTGKEIRLTGSAGTESEAKAILRRLRAQVDEERAPKTKASFRAAMDAWLRILDVQESTRESYEQYAPVWLSSARRMNAVHSRQRRSGASTSRSGVSSPPPGAGDGSPAIRRPSRGSPASRHRSPNLPLPPKLPKSSRLRGARTSAGEPWSGS